MKFKIILYILELLLLAQAEKRQKEQLPSVQLQSGLIIIGTENKTSDGNNLYHAYRGISFAEAPTGDRRFRPPVPLPRNLSGQVVYAVEDGPECVQLGYPVVGVEDCLYMNVYVPQITNSSELLPVMVWIYGGGFLFGQNSYSSYGPDYLLDENVVVVTFNYRLGIFGFLSTEDEASPGNYGLKDQILALHWVRDSIKSFGGNNSRITVFGQSAGAASNSYLSHTPLTKGLYQAAIFESGTSINLWALTRNPKKTAFAAGILLGVNTSTSQSLVDGLRKSDYKTLAQSELIVLEDILLLNGLPYGPTTEPLHPGAVITNKSYEQLQNGCFHRIPYIIGLTSEEGIIFEEMLNYGRALLLMYDVFLSELVPASLNINDRAIKNFVNIIIRKHYFGVLPVAISDERLIKFVSENQFNRPIIEAALLYCKFSPVYFYEFSYDGSLGTHDGSLTGANMIFYGNVDNVDLLETSDTAIYYYWKLTLLLSVFDHKRKGEEWVTGVYKTGSDDKKVINPPSFIACNVCGGVCPFKADVQTRLKTKCKFILYLLEQTRTGYIQELSTDKIPTAQVKSGFIVIGTIKGTLNENKIY
ncbi:hypothetical protein FQA39_LY00705 [Lamprigera yunnana]|nr:hypothetical protein FQA39_LY00705 [Lamprigera yunnana]